MRYFGIVRELDPTVLQINKMQQAVGACRFAQNALLASVKESFSDDPDAIIKRVQKKLDFTSPSIWTDRPMLVSTIVHFTIEEMKRSDA